MSAGLATESPCATTPRHAIEDSSPPGYNSLDYSWRNANIGSILDARRAGR